MPDRSAVLKKNNENIPYCTPSSLYYVAEQLKIAVNTDSQTFATQTCLGWARSPPPQSTDCSSFVPISLEMTRETFERISEPLFDRSMDPIVDVMIAQGVTIDDIDEVVMVGGSSRMPKIRELVRDELDMDDLNIEIDPDITVAFGCASVID